MVIARLQDSHVLLFSTLGVARWPSCGGPLCSHPWRWQLHQLYGMSVPNALILVLTWPDVHEGLCLRL